MTPTLARLLVQGLSSYGVDRVFAIPGVHNTELFRELKDAGIAVVLPRHEQSAGFMADGFARASGRAGVCLVVSGPGLTNVLTALGKPIPIPFRSLPFPPFSPDAMSARDAVNPTT